MRWLFMPLRRYARFSGRASRREFWPWILFVAGVIGACVMVNTQSEEAKTLTGGDFAVLFACVFWLATFLPSLAVAVRRLHDTNNRGWWILLIWAPALLTLFALIVDVVMTRSLLARTVIGGAALATMGGTVTILIWSLVPGTRGDNRFGENPLGATLEDLSATFE
jgi:uncharacterized membrane protein YhaH (DUF805 family)